MDDPLFVINPAGHGGAGIKVWERVQSEWPDLIGAENVHFTKRQGHAREIVAAAEGFEVLIAVGGDGTLGEVLAGIMEKSEPRPKLGIIPAGTGNDIARNLGILSFEQAIETLQGRVAREVDLIRIECQMEGLPAQRYAFLLGAVGFSAQTRIRPWMKRFLGPTGAYYLSTIMEIIAYRAPRMRVNWGTGEYSGRVWIVTVGNVERTSGGSMCLAPGARFDDGELNMAVIPSQSKWQMMTRMLPKTPLGAHVRESGVVCAPAKKIVVSAHPAVILDVDGDLFGMTPATFTVCPRAVQILCPERTLGPVP